MANPHFANAGDVWKHLLLTEVISWLRPGQYVETHAGSAAYRLADDDERALGAGVLRSESAAAGPLCSSPYRQHVLEFASRAEPSYPGSALLAMLLLGGTCRYVFCDTDPESVADLRAARDRLRLHDQVAVIHGDGLAETAARLQAGDLGGTSLVHVDPFDFDAAGPGAPSALGLLMRLAAAGIPVFAWYGLTRTSADHELFREVAVAAPAARAWCGELHVSGPRASAVGIGRGCGVLFAATHPGPAEAMRRAADAYVRAFNEPSEAVDAGVHVTASFVASEAGAG